LAPERYEMGPFGVQVSILEPGNFIAGTNIFNETFVQVIIKLYFLIFQITNLILVTKLIIVLRVGTSESDVELDG
jgi:hypothetical protein